MNHKVLYRVALFCLFSMLSAVLMHAGEQQQQSKGIVTGRIVDQQKQPYYPVAVAIEGVYIGGYTNENGVYHINDVPAGSQTIVVSGIGVKTKKVPIHVTAGKVNRIPDIEIDTQAEELEEVQVIGKSEARRQQEQAYAISVLDIKKAYNSAAPLNKLLNNVSSVRIREEGGMGSNYNFSLNGFSGNQVKFFLDGIPMDNFGSSFNLANISANMAERVEVYKGVLPVNLGADALGGAVNIVSRRDANYLDATYSFGSFNTHKVSVNGAYTHLKTGFTVRANAFYNYSDNDYKVFVPIIDLATNKKINERWVKRFNDAYRSGGIRLETGITNKPYADYLLAGIILSKNDKDVQTGATMDAVYGGVKMKSESVIPSIRYKKDDLFLDGLSLSLYGTYNSVNTFNVDTIARYYTPAGRCIQKPYDSSINEKPGKGKSSESSIEKYNQDLIDRYNHGEMVSADSIHFPDSLKCQTKKLGRTVYGGGGIMPDYFVPVDTTLYTDYHRNLVAKGVVIKTTMNFIEKNRKALLDKYKTFEKFNEKFEIDDQLLNYLREAADKEKIEFNEEQYNKALPLIKAQLKALIARDLWDMNEYFQVMNATNKSVERALEILNDKEYEKILK